MKSNVIFMLIFIYLFDDYSTISTSKTNVNSKDKTFRTFKIDNQIKKEENDSFKTSKKNFNKVKIDRNFSLSEKMLSKDNQPRGLVVNDISRETSINLNYIVDNDLNLSETSEIVKFTIYSGVYDRIKHFISLKGSGGVPFNFKASSTSLNVSSISVSKNCLQEASSVNSQIEEYYCVIVFFEPKEVQNGESLEASISLKYRQINMIECNTSNYNQPFIRLEIGSKYNLSVNFNTVIKIINPTKTVNRYSINEESLSDSNLYSSKIENKQDNNRLVSSPIITKNEINFFNDSLVKISDDESGNLLISINNLAVQNKFKTFYMEINNSFYKAIIEQQEKELSASNFSLFGLQYILSYSLIFLVIVYSSKFIYLNEKDTHVQMKISEEVAYIKAKTCSFYSESSNASSNPE